MKKQTSVSQHSSISQADDVSSPYSRVKGLPHDYAKVRGTEHPYAQLNAPSTSHTTHQASSAAAAAAAVVAGSSGDRTSQHSEGSREPNDTAPAQVEIPAASAIAGMISASQDLPYMTPPIANQHFSGDSQDSSSKLNGPPMMSWVYLNLLICRGLHKYQRAGTAGKYFGPTATRKAVY